LNALLEFGISRLSGVRHRWVLLPTDAAGPMTTAYCQEMYAFPPGLCSVPASDEFRSDDSFASVDGLSPLVRVDAQTYYSRRAAVHSLDRRLEAPSSLETLLDHFHSSSAEEQDSFLRACFWFYHAQTVFEESSSAGFTALICALESLMPDEKPLGKCPVCSRSVGRGSMRRLKANS
jgi:hypothetical protein